VRTESQVFTVVAVFLYLCAGTYAWWTDKASGGVEWAGTTALALSGTLAAVCGLYFGFVSRRIAPRPEDRPEATIEDGSGDVGFFAAASYWPLGIGLCAAAAAFGIAMVQWWLALAGFVGVLVATGGLLFQYYTGAGRPAD
jgi:cytochrome c oxidase subunit IV